MAALGAYLFEQRHILELLDMGSFAELVEAAIDEHLLRSDMGDPDERLIQVRLRWLLAVAQGEYPNWGVWPFGGELEVLMRQSESHP